MPHSLRFISASLAKSAALIISAGALFFAGCADHHDSYPTRHRTVTHHRDVVHDGGNYAPYDGSHAPSYSGHRRTYEDTSNYDEGDY